MPQKNRVIIVQLRRPNSNPDEMRSDPFWEFGSFGITSCHGHNLMSPQNAEKLSGVRFAFAQGGKRRGTRLVYLTPPVEIKTHCDRIEALWSPNEMPYEMPFRYADAPILISNEHRSNFPQFESSMASGHRSTPEGQFSSNFRSRTSCLDDTLSDELVEIYTEMRRRAPDSAIAHSYVEALPWPPPRIDDQRERTYEMLLNGARGEMLPTKQSRRPSKGGCRPAFLPG